MNQLLNVNSINNHIGLGMVILFMLIPLMQWLFSRWTCQLDSGQCIRIIVLNSEYAIQVLGAVDIQQDSFKVHLLLLEQSGIYVI